MNGSHETDFIIKAEEDDANHLAYSAVAFALPGSMLFLNPNLYNSVMHVYYLKTIHYTEDERKLCCIEIHRSRRTFSQVWQALSKLTEHGIQGLFQRLDLVGALP